MFKKKACIKGCANGELLDRNRVSFLEKVLSVMPGNVYWKDRNGVMLGCNDNNLKYLGRKTQEEVYGKTDYELLDRKTADMLSKIDRSVIENAAPV
ncbi:MAG: hypothetical protein KAS93_07450, partial [Gammaproteobacteria bacterium]|nr:hypothetical protein [Gammaproteobacteria bacterium]